MFIVWTFVSWFRCLSFGSHGIWYIHMNACEILNSIAKNQITDGINFRMHCLLSMKEKWCINWHRQQSLVKHGLYSRTYHLISCFLSFYCNIVNTKYGIHKRMKYETKRNNLCDASSINNIWISLETGNTLMIIISWTIN